MVSVSATAILLYKRDEIKVGTKLIKVGTKLKVEKHRYTEVLGRASIRP